MRQMLKPDRKRGFGGALNMHSEYFVLVTRSERMQYTMCLGGAWFPMFTTHPNAVYPGGAIGSQREQSELTLTWPSPPPSLRIPENKPMRLNPTGFRTRPYVLLTASTACDGGIGLRNT